MNFETHQADSTICGGGGSSEEEQIPEIVICLLRLLFIVNSVFFKKESPFPILDLFPLKSYCYSCG